MYQAPIALLAIALIKPPQIAIFQLAECGRFLLLQLTALYSEKDLSRSRSFALITKVPLFAHPFGCHILEGFSIQFRRGLFYLVTTSKY